MNLVKWVGMGVTLAALVLVGCGEEPGKGSAASKKTVDRKSTAEENHSHGKGPNGGVVFDLGKYHAEFTVDHSAKEATVLFVTGDDKDAKALEVAATEFTLTIKETKTKEGTIVPKMTLKLLPKDAKEGKAARFVGTDPGIGHVADFEGTVVGVIDGKPSEGAFKE